MFDSCRPPGELKSSSGRGFSLLEGLQLQFVPVRGLGAVAPRPLVVIAIGDSQLFVLVHCLQGPDALDGSEAGVDKPAPIRNTAFNSKIQ